MKAAAPSFFLLDGENGYNGYNGVDGCNGVDGDAIKSEDGVWRSGINCLILRL